MPDAHPFTTSPVLLGGENRSGTTLLSVVLDSHPDLVVGPEMTFLEPQNLGPHILAAADLVAARLHCITGMTESATRSFFDPSWYDGVHFVVQCLRFGLELDDLRELITKVMGEASNDIRTFADRCRLINEIGEFRRVSTGARRWGMKLQREIIHVDTYARLWPRAHFLHIVRDGRDLAASHLNTVPDWGYRTITEAARGWLEVVSCSHRAAPPDRYLEVRYEDLVSQPKATLVRILGHLGLPWEEGVLRHAEHEHTLLKHPYGHPSAGSAGKPLHGGRLARYVEDLTRAQILEFEQIAGSELARLGYSSVQTSASKPER
ncbi:putative modular protein [Mesorhizobium prunaredense]|uniref:Putative modular protein n=1 Tax=Mesorhizobium prunaredense TaxID=1631249 RepID=A0A1R3V7X1_9HYPH|nr:sulfotransferase [Mesorhizobium prunaredense]SIT56006.1 putative modular protein [Mesorhizobium prunaredense]